VPIKTVPYFAIHAPIWKDPSKVDAKLIAKYWIEPPYAPIRRQFLNLLRAVNRARKAAGFELLPKEVLPLRRRVVRPFDLDGPEQQRAEGEAGSTICSLNSGPNSGPRVCASISVCFTNPLLHCSYKERATGLEPATSSLGS
jgi:hypothetical protein